MRIFDVATKTLFRIDAPHAQPDIMCSKDRLSWAQILDADGWQTYAVVKW